MTREEAYNLLTKHLTNKNLIKHCLACEIAMKNIARELGENEGDYALAGLLHDIDYDLCDGNFELHGKKGYELLGETDLSEEIRHAIKVHPGTGSRKTNMDRALYSVDHLTGLIVSSTLMHPSKKIENVDVGFIINRFNEKRFSANVNREQIKTCCELGFSLEDFIALTLNSMKSISDELGF